MSLPDVEEQERISDDDAAFLEKFETDEEKGNEPGDWNSEGPLKPVTREELEAFKAKQEKTGIIYISRIPPAMRPSKVRHIMSQYGAVGRIYLQREDPKRAYLRRKHTSTKKAHYTEGWVEFEDKKVARSVAEVLNAQPVGGKRGTRFHDDIWTMKYLPRIKWNMLTEHIAHEAAVRRDKLRMELSQSREEQNEYLRRVELKRVLDKRAERKRKREDEDSDQIKEDVEQIPSHSIRASSEQKPDGSSKKNQTKKLRIENPTSKVVDQTEQLDSVLSSIF